MRQKLKWVLSDPEKLRPSQTRQGLTEVAAGEFAEVAKRLRERGHEAQQVAHYINRLVFCMFAEDVQLLPNEMFRRMLEHALEDPDDFERLASDLFGAMKDGGRIGFEKVSWFNGGLFDDTEALPLRKDEIELTLKAAKRDWSEIDPSIFGTLFERGLDPDKRSQLGAHYTDRDKIMMLVEPVVVRPWREEWEKTRETIREATEKADKAKSKAQRTKAAKPSRGSLQGLPRPTEGVPGAGSGLWIGELPLPLPPGAEGPRTPSGSGRGDVRSCPRVPNGRPTAGQRHRTEFVRGRACPRHDLDRGNPVDAPERLRRVEAPDPQTARQHRVQRRDPSAGWR